MPTYRVYFDRHAAYYHDVQAESREEALHVVQEHLDQMDGWERAHLSQEMPTFDVDDAVCIDEPTPGYTHGDYEDYNTGNQYPDSFTNEQDQQTADPDLDPYGDV